MTTAAVNASRSRETDPNVGSLESRLRDYRYGVVLLLLVITYVVAATAPPDEWTRLATIVLQALTLVVAMAASRVSRRTLRVTTIVMVLTVLSAVALLPLDSRGDNFRGAYNLVSVLLVGMAPVVIVRAIVQRPVIDVRTVLGALCVYVLIGMMFAFAYGAVGTLDSRAFFAQQVHADIPDYLYFSYVTQTTVGYGDLTAATGFGRALAVLEALIGQIYLVTVISLIVGSMRPRQARAPTATGDGTISATGEDTA
jgi:hypothetical protein